MEFYDKYADSVYRLALSFCKTPSDAEDILQDVFLKLMSKNPLIGAGKEKAYILKMTANIAKNHLKSISLNQTSEFDENEHSPTYTMTTDELEMYDILMHLPDIYRTIIYLYFYEEISYKEISKILGISVSAVAMRLSRAKEELKAILDKEENL